MLPGFKYLPKYIPRADQEALVIWVRDHLKSAPLFTPRMPNTGKPFSVRMSNAGHLGWVSDQAGYRYQKTHPETDTPWPPIPDILNNLWHEVSGNPDFPEACLINWYGPNARMGLHQDRDEEDLTAPVVSLSLGDSALFRFGPAEKRARTHSIRLNSGDVVILAGGARLARHGIDRVLPTDDDLLQKPLLAVPGRINLTLRRVTSLKKRGT